MRQHTGVKVNIVQWQLRVPSNKMNHIVGRAFLCECGWNGGSRPAVLAKQRDGLCMQAASQIGSFMGPVLGGIIADQAGFR